MGKNIYLYTEENKYEFYRDIYKIIIGKKYITIYGNDERIWELEKENYIMVEIENYFEKEFYKTTDTIILCS